MILLRRVLLGMSVFLPSASGAGVMPSEKLTSLKATGTHLRKTHPPKQIDHYNE